MYPLHSERVAKRSSNRRPVRCQNCKLVSFLYKETTSIFRYAYAVFRFIFDYVTINYLSAAKAELVLSLQFKKNGK